MSPTIEIPDTASALRSLSDKAPHWLALLLVVGGFLAYLYKHDQMMLEQTRTGDLVAMQRINECHSVQERGHDVMEKLAGALSGQTIALESLKSAVANLDSRLNDRQSQ